jgi:hypothetical protein
MLAVILLTGKTIPFDNSTERYFVTGDPALLEYDNLIELFGDNEYLIVGFEVAEGVSDVFNEDILTDLARVTEFLEFHDNITQVRSLTTFQYIHADGDDLRTDYLIDDVEELISNPAAVEQVKEILAEEGLAIGTLVTADYRHTRLAARVEYNGETSEIKI